MKSSQDHFTTHEQSVQLLELGLPNDSADCYYEGIGFNNGYVTVPQICNNRRFGINVIDLPCWSVGRLIEIFLLCTPYCEIPINKSDKVEQMIASFFKAHKDGLLNFSKLEL